MVYTVRTDMHYPHTQHTPQKAPLVQQDNATISILQKKK